MFQHVSMSYFIPVVGYQSSFYETLRIGICMNIKAFNQINRKQLNILKTYLEFYIVAY